MRVCAYGQIWLDRCMWLRTRMLCVRSMVNFILQPLLSFMGGTTLRKDDTYTYLVMQKVCVRVRVFVLALIFDQKDSVGVAAAHCSTRGHSPGDGSAAGTLL